MLAPAVDKTSLSDYNEKEFQLALARLLTNACFLASFRSSFPDLPVDLWRAKASTITSVSDFQHGWVGPTIDSLVRATMASFSVGGFEHLRKGARYLFVSNHHDILLDAALLCNESVRYGLETPKVCLGDNLLVTPLITDLVKMNKGLTVRRGVSTRELLRWSIALSQLIREAIENDIDSVWIAQREGRAKDGRDLTQPGLIKMLALSGDGSFLSRLTTLHPVTVATSYEYEPCAAEKAREVFLTRRNGKYEKESGEDLRSMREGLFSPKGRVHLQIGHDLSDEISSFPELPKNKMADMVARLIDRTILSQFHCWPSHFAAEALLRGDTQPRQGTSNEVKEFKEYMEVELSKLGPTLSNDPSLRQCFLELYANPVIGQLGKKRA